jgi:hypothetical protein
VPLFRPELRKNKCFQSLSSRGKMPRRHVIRPPPAPPSSTIGPNYSDASAETFVMRSALWEQRRLKMSVHFTVSGLTRNLIHSLGLDHERAPRPLSPEQNLLLECYLAGQIPESAWSDYVFETPELQRHVNARRAQH